MICFVDALPGGGFEVRLVSVSQSRIDAFYDADSRERIQRRRDEIVCVVTAVFDHQERFLVEGSYAIEPLQMQQIADKVGVHVTTVSRAIGDKWVQTPVGLYPLKKFFDASSSNEATNPEIATTIQTEIRQLIGQEDSSKPYSDAELVVWLGTRGFAVARRTVTKYRKKLGIPSLRQRRR